MASGRPSSEPVYIEEPAFSRWLFGSSKAAWIWLVARLWLGWEWLQAGWSKVFGGNITWKVWDRGDSAYSLTGDGNIGWVRSGTVATEEGQQRALQVGDAVAGFARGALDRAPPASTPISPTPGTWPGWSGCATPATRSSGRWSPSARSSSGSA